MGKSLASLAAGVAGWRVGSSRNQGSGSRAGASLCPERGLHGAAELTQDFLIHAPAFWAE